jgi:hypothetical protein
MSVAVEYMLPLTEDELVALFCLLLQEHLTPPERAAIERIQRKLQLLKEGR